MIMRLNIVNVWREFITPFDFYTSKLQNDIKLLMTTIKYRSIYTNKFENNIDLISKMLYKKHKLHFKMNENTNKGLNKSNKLSIIIELRTEEINK